MFRMVQQFSKQCFLAVLGAVLVAPLAYAQTQPNNVLSELERKAVQQQHSTPTTIPVACVLQHPGQVQRFRITCSGTHRVDVKTADCCLEGDHWQLKLKQWDTRPNTAVTTSPGGVFHFGVVGRVYNYNVTQPIEALLECSYLHGINVFPAETYILVEHSSGSCSVTELGLSDLIDRSP